MAPKPKRAPKTKRPVFLPTPAEEYINSDSTANVYVRSTHYSSQPGGSLSATSEFLSVQESETIPEVTAQPCYMDNFSYELETDFSIYLASLNNTTCENENTVEGGHVPKIRRVVSEFWLIQNFSVLISGITRQSQSWNGFHTVNISCPSYFDLRARLRGKHPAVNVTKG